MRSRVARPRTSRTGSRFGSASDASRIRRSRMKPFALPHILLALFAVVVPEAQGQWSTESLSSPRRSIAAVSAGNLAFFAGGRDGNIVSAVVDIYNAASGAWTVDTLSVPRSYLAAT